MERTFKNIRITRSSRNKQLACRGGFAVTPVAFAWISGERGVEREEKVAAADDSLTSAKFKAATRCVYSDKFRKRWRPDDSVLIDNRKSHVQSLEETETRRDLKLVRPVVQQAGESTWRMNRIHYGKAHNYFSTENA
jgi:hypothetical protein